MSNIDAFAELLVRLVRDQAIRNCSATLNAGRSPIAKAWALAIGDAKPKRIEETIIPDCIDEAIFCLLDAIDNGLQLTFTAPNGEKIELPTEGLGELAGWYMGPDSWRERFSGEKINNYLD